MTNSHPTHLSGGPTAMTIANDRPEKSARSLLERAWQDKQLVFAASFVLIEMLLIPFAPLIAPYSPVNASLEDKLLPPSWVHLLGTDSNGSDILSRLIFAPRVDLVVAIAATLIAACVGTPFGIVAGYIRGALGESLVRIGDVILTFPVFVLALVVVAAFGQGQVQTILVVGFVQAPIYLRLMFGVSAALAHKGFVESARLSGASRIHIIARHILPNTFGPLFVQISITIGLSILLVSGLSFVGAGIQAPTPEWGSMIATGSLSLVLGYWWPSVFPGLAIGTTVMGFALLSERLAALLEPDIA